MAAHGPLRALRAGWAGAARFFGEDGVPALAALGGPAGGFIGTPVYGGCRSRAGNSPGSPGPRG